MKRLWILTAATIALLGMLFIPLLLSTPTLASAALTNAAMLALPNGLNSPFAIRYSIGG